MANHTRKWIIGGESLFFLTFFSRLKWSLSPHASGQVITTYSLGDIIIPTGMELKAWWKMINLSFLDLGMSNKFMSKLVKFWWRRRQWDWLYKWIWITYKRECHFIKSNKWLSAKNLAEMMTFTTIYNIDGIFSI